MAAAAASGVWQVSSGRPWSSFVRMDRVEAGEHLGVPGDPGEAVDRAAGQGGSGRGVRDRGVEVGAELLVRRMQQPGQHGAVEDVTGAEGGAYGFRRRRD